MEGLTILFAVLAAVFALLFFRQRTELGRLRTQTGRFLSGGARTPLSLRDGRLAALQNDFEAIEGALELSRAETVREARRSTELLTDISHQLKTPLASLRLFLELDEGAHKNEALAQADRMEGLIYALLRLERMSNDGYAFRFEARQLAPLVQEAWDGLRVRFPEKRFSLTGDAVLRCDPGWLGEAFSNLLKNACEHTEPRGSVSVAITQTEREVRLTFSDDGGGVAPEELPRLFERFYQAKGGAQSGAGIGLNIVREIVARHHGTIVPENSEGGLRFTLYFPRLEQSLAKT